MSPQFFKESTFNSLRRDKNTRAIKIKKGECIKESGRKEIGGIEARKLITDEYVKYRDKKNRDNVLRRKFGFGPKQREKINTAIFLKKQK